MKIELQIEMLYIVKTWQLPTNSLLLLRSNRIQRYILFEAVLLRGKTTRSLPDFGCLKRSKFEAEKNTKVCYCRRSIRYLQSMNWQ